MRENRLRRMADRQGLILVKSRRRDPQALDYGMYVLVADKKGNRISRSGSGEATREFRDGGMTLDGVEDTLTGLRMT